MTVLIKLLYGSFYVKAYDWLKVVKSSTGTISGVAYKVINGILNAPRETSILFPRSGGNSHRFSALTPCAILDMLSPPYSQDLGRPSTCQISPFPLFLGIVGRYNSNIKNDEGIPIKLNFRGSPNHVSDDDGVGATIRDEDVLEFRPDIGLFDMGVIAA
ncbi:hypothetical protein JRO89_XS07G0132300 [Xanthoceras sorbifolium]|uniref:cysteine dioxygenase n=1 Tax=Xanthoceras sorbifolium TaxID=99658 RepID=A0ABQ8HTM0_9ROSI|nr:hypothetical protein JRO89_XS07G0132300 [Xanthoceras sorbifolium]